MISSEYRKTYSEALYKKANEFYYDDRIQASEAIAFEYYQKAAMLGHAKAMYELSTFYRYGCRGLDIQDDKMVDYFKNEAAKHGINGSNDI